MSSLAVEASLVPASEALSKLVEEIYETLRAVNDVLFEKESFLALKSYLERIVPILKELTKKNFHNSKIFDNFVEILNGEIKLANQLTLECSKRNKFYLVLNCRKIAKRLENTIREISRALSLIQFAQLDLSLSINEEISTLCDDMMKAEVKAAVAEEEILKKIELGIEQRNSDRSYANNLLNLIAEAVGISTNRSELKKEFDEFKSELEDAQLRKDQAEAIQMDQIIALLGRADAASSPQEKEMKYFQKRESLGKQELEPLLSFYCPITRDVMVDPVETSSGQTFERSAIEKWLADGNATCPLTMTPLKRVALRPNITLRKSIEEWKERNRMIKIASMKSKLCSVNEQEVLHCLSELKDLCEEKESHREWVALENYIPLLVGFLGGSNTLIKNGSLALLCILAKDSDDIKERIAEAENSIEFIARSLARRIGEAKLAVALLLELSKNESVLNCIGNVRGCIFLLVTISNSDNYEAASDARKLLENLSFLDENVVQMAKANYFKPLLQRLSSGSDSVKMIMATALAEMELTDHSKSALFEDGALKALLHLISRGDAEAKQASVKALQNLSSLPKNGLLMIREGAVSPLLELLHLPISSPSLREQVATTIMNLAISSTQSEVDGTPVSFLESDDNISKLFSLINLTGPKIQQSILQTFYALCQLPTATNTRDKLRQCSAVQVLGRLCENSNLTLRASAVKLFFCLTEDAAESDEATLVEHVSQRCLETLHKIITISLDEEERAAAMGIISNLPEGNTHFTQWLLEDGALPTVVKFLTDGNYNGSSKYDMAENAVGALRRFTISSNLEWQKRAAETGIIPILVQLLGTGTALAKCYAAISLAQFSENSPGLSSQVKKSRGFLCFSPPPETGCPVHMGICSVESSFCLVEAEAVGPLVRVLGEPDFRSSEASLRALSTLIDGESLQNGCKVLDEMEGIAPIVKLLSSRSSELQEKALSVLERIFRLVEFKQKYGGLAQMPLVDITQRGNSTMKSMAARTLAHLNVLHDQSSYF